MSWAPEILYYKCQINIQLLQHLHRILWLNNCLWFSNQELKKKPNSILRQNRMSAFETHLLVRNWTGVRIPGLPRDSWIFKRERFYSNHLLPIRWRSGVCMIPLYNLKLMAQVFIKILFQLSSKDLFKCLWLVANMTDTTHKQGWSGGHSSGLASWQWTRAGARR